MIQTSDLPTHKTNDGCFLFSFIIFLIFYSQKLTKGDFCLHFNIYLRLRDPKNDIALFDETECIDVMNVSFQLGKFTMQGRLYQGFTLLTHH